MNNLLNNGSQSLLAFQRAIATTSHNIANLNTEGYSRQRVDLEAVNPATHENGYIGKGVRATGVERLHDQFAMSQILQSTSSHAQHESHRMLASRIDNLVADDALSLTPVMNDFFDAMQDVNGNPTSSATREVFVSSTDGLAARLNNLQQQFDSSQEEVNQRAQSAVEEVNVLASQVADLNLRIQSTGFQGSGTEPNDLLDRRDNLISKLSEFTDVSKVTRDDRAVDVFMGNGVELVVGSRASELRTGNNSLNANELKIEVSNGNSWKDVTTRLSGGTIGGLQEFESQTLRPSMNQLGHIALQFADSINTQHAKGVDLNGNPGADIFTTSEPVVLGSDTNTGNATMTSAFTDISQVEPTEYDVRFTGSDFRITRLSDQTQTDTSLPITIDGMEVSFTGVPEVGDTFRISPVRRAAGNIESLLNDPNALAISSPLRSTGSLANISDSSVSSPRINDIDNASLRDEIDIRFNNGSSYDLIDGTSGATLSSGVAFTPGTPISFNGWELDIEGTPTTGDEFTVLANTTAQGNNSNGLALAALQSTPEMGGDTSFNEAYGTLVSRVGGQTRNLETRSDALNNMRLDAIERQQSVSGVNLDEEAINLSRYEQAYQASAQIISTADTLFQTILNTVRR